MERAAPDGKERASDSPPCCASTTDFTRPRFFFSSRRLHTISLRDWSSDVCSSDLTVTRNEFIPMQGGVVGFAIVHSKLIVVDPFTNPVVVTGSHNFSGSASSKNDENFVIIR